MKPHSPATDRLHHHARMRRSASVGCGCHTGQAGSAHAAKHSQAVTAAARGWLDRLAAQTSDSHQTFIDMRQKRPSRLPRTALLSHLSAVAATGRPRCSTLPSHTADGGRGRSAAAGARCLLQVKMDTSVGSRAPRDNVLKPRQAWHVSRSSAAPAGGSEGAQASAQVGPSPTNPGWPNGLRQFNTQPWPTLQDERPAAAHVHGLREHQPQRQRSVLERRSQRSQAAAHERVH